MTHVEDSLNVLSLSPLGKSQCLSCFFFTPVFFFPSVPHFSFPPSPLPPKSPHNFFFALLRARQGMNQLRGGGGGGAGRGGAGKGVINGKYSGWKPGASPQKKNLIAQTLSSNTFLPQKKERSFVSPPPRSLHARFFPTFWVCTTTKKNRSSIFKSLWGVCVCVRAMQKQGEWGGVEA